MQSFLQVNFEFEVKLRGILLSELLNDFNFLNQIILRCTLNIKRNFDFTLQISIEKFQNSTVNKEICVSFKKEIISGFCVDLFFIFAIFFAWKEFYFL